MKRARRVFCVCLFASLAILLAGCGTSLPNGFGGGETVTPERLSELHDRMLAAAAGTGPEEERDTVPSRGVVPVDPETTSDGPEPDRPAATDSGTDAPLPEGTVYWTAGGTVFHTDRDCYHLAKSTDVRSGSTADAEAAGKTGLCSSCAKRAGTDTRE